MATVLENLQSRRATVAQLLADIDSSAAGGKPDEAASGIEHTAYRLSLYRELEMLDKRIAASGGGTFEIHSRAVSG